TTIGDRGVQLSGGQRQRLAIARAVLRRPKILILDEATSALDSELESVVQQSLRALDYRPTTLIIAHRLSTVASVDRGVVLHRGRIVDTGRHDELVHASPFYRQLVQTQITMPCPGCPSGTDPERRSAAARHRRRQAAGSGTGSAACCPTRRCATRPSWSTRGRDCGRNRRGPACFRSSITRSAPSSTRSAAARPACDSISAARCTSIRPTGRTGGPISSRAPTCGCGTAHPTARST